MANGAGSELSHEDRYVTVMQSKEVARDAAYEQWDTLGTSTARTIKASMRSGTSRCASDASASAGLIVNSLK